MAFLSGIVKSSLSLLGKDSSSFPYTLGSKVEWYNDRSIWALHHGTKKDDGTEVSIFVFDGNRHRDKVQLARNAFKRIRTIRHPDILRYIDGVESDQGIMFVTEPVDCLANQLHHELNSNLILWGIYKIANAIAFINNDCNLVHGYIRPSSVFTTKAGEWKLGGFELLSSMVDESPMILTFGALVADSQKYSPPEVNRVGWSVVKGLPISAVDAYQLGCLIYEAYNRRFDRADDIQSRSGSIPQPMLSAVRSLVSESPQDRSSASAFLATGSGPSGFFSTDFVKVNLFLESISIKEQQEKDIFFRKLDGVIDSFPHEFSKNKLLPELVKGFEFGSGGAKTLKTILKIGENLSTEEYEDIIIAPVTRMFSSPDRAIRLTLLEHMSTYAPHIPNKTATNQIFPNIVTGFTDTIPQIREQTIKAILLLVPKLSDRIINHDLLKYFAKLQLDDEPGIRTNTTICLGKISKYLKDSTRQKVLVPAFTRALRDGFHHARISALMALAATGEYYSAEDCASRIIPNVSPLLIDKEKSVRVQASKTMTYFISRIEELTASMPETSLEMGGDVRPAADSVNVGGSSAGLASALAGWAVSSIQSKIYSPSGTIVTPPIETPQSDTSSASSMRFASSTSLEVANEQEPFERVSSGWGNVAVDDLYSILKPSTEPTDTPSETTKPKPEFDTESDNAPFQRSTIASFQLPSTNTSGGGGLKLSTLSKPLVYSEENQDNDGSQIMTREEKRAEMDRRREERRQRLAELRDKKKSGLGAKKVSSLSKPA